MFYCRDYEQKRKKSSSFQAISMTSGSSHVNLERLLCRKHRFQTPMCAAKAGQKKPGAGAGLSNDQLNLSDSHHDGCGSMPGSGSDGLDLGAPALGTAEPRGVDGVSSSSRTGGLPFSNSVISSPLSVSYSSSP